MNHDMRRERRIEKRSNGYVSPTSRIDHRRPRREKSRFTMLFLFSVLISGIGIGAGIFYQSHSIVDEINLPIIMEAKQDACIKVRPDATDNAPVPYSNISIYSELEERAKEPVVEQLLPEPEKPTLEAKKEEEKIDEPPIEVVKLESSTLEQQSASVDKEIIVSKANQTKHVASSEPVKPRENFNDAMQKTLRDIYTDAEHMIVENVTHGKKMPSIEQPNSNLKIVSQKKVISDTTVLNKDSPKMIDAVVSKKTNPPVQNLEANPAGREYWVEFKPLSSSKEAEHLWHQLITTTSAKTALVGAQHKIQRHSSAAGSISYNLSAGPFSKDSALACCQRLRQAKVNCRVLKKIGKQ